jgi:hypothetical protein
MVKSLGDKMSIGNYLTKSQEETIKTLIEKGIIKDRLEWHHQAVDEYLEKTLDSAKKKKEFVMDDKKTLAVLLEDSGVKEGDYVKVSLKDKDSALQGYLVQISEKPRRTMVFDKKKKEWTYGEDAYFILLSLYKKGEKDEDIPKLLPFIRKDTYGVVLDRDIKLIERIM